MMNRSSASPCRFRNEKRFPRITNNSTPNEEDFHRSFVACTEERAIYWLVIGTFTTMIPVALLIMGLCSEYQLYKGFAERTMLYKDYCKAPSQYLAYQKPDVVSSTFKINKLTKGFQVERDNLELGKEGEEESLRISPIAISLTSLIINWEFCW